MKAVSEPKKNDDIFLRQLDDRSFKELNKLSANYNLAIMEKTRKYASYQMKTSRLSRN